MTPLKKIFLIALLLIGSNTVAQENTIQKVSFKVWGNCDMCKSKIEKAAKSVDGVSSAKWNVSSGKIVVKFDSDKTKLDQIEDAIVAVGYDVENKKATEEAYNKLHNCCKYDREL